MAVTQPKLTIQISLNFTYKKRRLQPARKHKSSNASMVKYASKGISGCARI